MDRRTFLKLAGGAVAYAALPAQAEAHNPLRYPLVSVADKGTTPDETKAAKARKVAEYAVTRNKQQGLRSYNPNSTIGNDYQGVQAVMTIDGQRYTVWIANHNENAKLTLPDMMSVWVRPEGTTGQSELTTFTDTGLDGRCDFGIIPAKVSGTGKQLLFREEAGRPEGVEHKQRFQSLYDQTLDKLVKFYERPRAK